MKTGDKTAVGIDISQDRISIVLLRSGKDGPELLKSASTAVPDGAVKDGNIEDPVLLSKAIRELRHRSGIRAKRAAVSLFARPVVVQILDMPKQAPTNIRQFVNSEMKNCVVLPSRDVAIDFCGISSARRAADKKVLAVAAESARMVELVRACGKAGFRVELIEPALLAYLRAIHGQKITGKTGCNVLVAILQGTTLTLCVLRNGIVDFIRTKEIAKTSEDLSHWLADELSEVIKFYDVEVSENTGKWDVTVFIDFAHSPQITESSIKSSIQAEHLQVRTIEDAYLDTLAGGSAAVTDEKPSPVAIGLAINLLMRQGADLRTNPPDVLRINLLPPQITRVREAKRDALIAVNAVAVVGLIMVLAINGFALLIERATRGALAKEPFVKKQDTSVLLEQQNLLERQLGVLTTRLDGIAKIRASQRDVNWAKMFDEIRKAAPGSVRITAMSCQDGSSMMIQGLALSSEAVYSFVSLLEKSPGIASVTLLETREQNWRNGLITYQLSCKLDIRSDKADDVG
ncbi:MAG: pilus assembly protein PilM [Planctomycetota bacterium]